MSKAARDRSARERLAAERARQAAKARQRRLLAIVLGAVAVVAVVVAVTVVVLDRQGRRDQTASPYHGPQAPLTRQADGSVAMAKPGVNAPVVEVFEDFQCPACKTFEETTGKTLKELAAEGRAKVVYRPFHLFGEQRDPIRSNSMRSAAAALCVPAPQWLSYHDALFRFQPQEGSEGFATEDLVAWGRDVGVTDPNFERCVTEQQKKPQVEQMTTYALQTRRVQGTPTLFLDGRQLGSEIQSPAALEKAVNEARGAQ
jgi:protein-disulfide isomerase